MRSESDIMQQRIENQIVAVGKFTANDLVTYGVSPEDFTDIEPRNTQKNPAKKTHNDKTPTMRVHLFNTDRSQQIGMISLKKIQCRRRTSFLNLVADQMLEIVPILGVDFSMANLTFDERKCIHSVNEDKPNEYRDLL